MRSVTGKGISQKAFFRHGGFEGDGGGPGPAPPLIPPTSFNFRGLPAGGTPGYIASDDQGNTLFICQETPAPRVFLSTDGGITFNQIGAAVTGVTGDQSRLVFGGGRFLFGHSHTSVQVSTDAGQSWNVVDTGLTGLTPIQLTYTDNGTWFASQNANGPDFFYALSTDGGASWLPIFYNPNPPPPSFASPVIFSNVPAVFTGGMTLFAGFSSLPPGHNQINVSIDAGRTWTGFPRSGQWQSEGMNLQGQLFLGQITSLNILNGDSVPDMIASSPAAPAFLNGSTVLAMYGYFNVGFVTSDVNVVVTGDKGQTWQNVVTGFGGVVGGGQMTYDVVNKSAILTTSNGEIGTSI